MATWIFTASGATSVAVLLGIFGLLAWNAVQGFTGGIEAQPLTPAEQEALGPDTVEALRELALEVPSPPDLITDGPPRGPIAEFLRFELSPPGEAILVEMGFYPVVAAWEERNAHLRAGPADGEPRQGGSP